MGNKRTNRMYSPFKTGRPQQLHTSLLKKKPSDGSSANLTEATPLWSPETCHGHQRNFRKWHRYHVLILVCLTFSYCISKRITNIVGAWIGQRVNWWLQANRFKKNTLKRLHQLFFFEQEETGKSHCNRRRMCNALMRARKLWAGVREHLNNCS